MRLGIVGTGMIVEEFLSIKDQLSGIQITSIFNPRRTEEEIMEYAHTHKIPKGFIQYDSFLRSDLDTVYIAVPNSNHFEFAMTALENGKNVIVEKPMVMNFSQAEILERTAKKNRVFLFEAITTIHLPNYKFLKEKLNEIGKVHITICNFSQYSSRYDNFLKGIVAPAFDPNMAGGAIMDINSYNIHFIMGLFGVPKGVKYFPNMTRGIDTSGILLLQYKGHQVTSIGSKDSRATSFIMIQGEKGMIRIDSTTNTVSKVSVQLVDGEFESFDFNQGNHRMIDEFQSFNKIMEDQDYESCWKYLDHSVKVSQVLTQARYSAELYFQGENSL